MSFEHSTSSLQEDTPKNQNSEEILAIAKPEEIAAIKEKKISKKVDVKNIVKHKMEELISDIETSEMHKKRLEGKLEEISHDMELRIHIGKVFQSTPNIENKNTLE